MTRNLKEFVNQTDKGRVSSLPVTGPEVAILLGLYNGANVLEDQLDSLCNQTHQNWSLILSDDGSTDRWLQIVTDFANRKGLRQLKLMNGPRRGFAQNFLSLVQAAGPIVPYAAFCDQDDVWQPRKLATALRALSTIPPGVPGIYCGRTVITDHRLRPIGKSLAFRRPPSFENALIQSIAGGNTMVLNRAAIDLLQDSSRHAQDIVSHDWWTYQLVTGAGGRVIYDRNPQVLYRQHARNQIGQNTGLAASARRLQALMRGRFRQWNGRNARALHGARHWLTPDARACLEAFQMVRNGGLFQRLRILKRGGFYRQTHRGTLALWFAALIRQL